MKDSRKLNIWDHAQKAVLSISKIAKSFPTEEKFGPTSQRRCAAVSIPAKSPRANECSTAL
jgi:four helix bundle protein